MLSFFKLKYHILVSDERFSEILTGSVWALVARVVGQFCMLLASIAIARFYGADVMGIVAVTTSFLTLATILTVMGTNTALLRLIPEHLVNFSATSAFKLYRKTQFMVIGVSLFTSAIFFLGADFIADRIFSKPHLAYYFALASVFIVFKSIMLLNTRAVRGLKLIKAFALMQILPNSLFLLLLIAFGLLWENNDVPVYALLGGFALTGMAGWAIMEIVFRKRMGQHDQVQSMSAKEILAISLPMLVTSTMSFVVGQTGVLILGIFRPEAEVGYYAIAVKLATLTTFMLSAINAMAAPKFSELYHSGNLDELFHVAKKSTKLIFWTTAPLLIFLIVLGRPVLSMFFGQDFTVAYWALFFLVLGQFANSISGSTGYFMNMTGHQNVFRNVMMLAAAINLILNFALIPHFGLYGAALTGMFCMVFWNACLLGYMKRKFGKTICFFPVLTR